MGPTVRAVRRRLCAGVLTALGCVGLAGPGTASAAPVRYGTADSLQGGPFLAGADLAYSQATSRRYSLRTLRRGARPTVLAAGTLRNNNRFGEGDSQSVNIAASAQRFAFSDLFTSGTRYGYTTTVRINSGPLAGPRAGVAQCTRTGNPPTAVTVNGQIDVDANALAYVGCDGRAVVRDFALGAPVPTRVLATRPRRGSERAALGPVRRRPDVQRHPGRGLGIQLRAVHGAPGPDDSIITLDIQSDGTMAALRPLPGVIGINPCQGGRVDWYSRAQPFSHRLNVLPCTADLRLAGGRVALIEGTGQGATDQDEPQEVRLIALGGQASRIASVGPDGTKRGEIDFDGSRISYGVRNCRGSSDLLVASTSERPRGLSTRCPVAISLRGARLRGRRVTVGLRCSRGCLGRGRLERRIRGRFRAAGPRRKVSLRASRRTRRVSFALSRSARRTSGHGNPAHAVEHRDHGSQRV